MCADAEVDGCNYAFSFKVDNKLKARKNVGRD